MTSAATMCLKVATDIPRVGDVVSYREVPLDSCA